MYLAEVESAFDALEDRLGENAAERGQGLAARREQADELGWGRKDVLTDWDVGQDALDEVMRNVVRTASAAARTQAPTFAGVQQSKRPKVSEKLPAAEDAPKARARCG